MQEIIQGNMALVTDLSALCDERTGVRHGTDMDGNTQHWFTIKEPELMEEAAKAIQAAGGRLAMISGYKVDENMRQMGFTFGACYHFDVDGVVFNVTARMNARHPDVPTITPWFANADWHEREMQELVGIKVTNQPGRERLFLDPELDRGLLGKVVPLSVMMNGACSTDLWEHILSTRGGKA